MNPTGILDKAVAGERLSFDEGCTLFDCRDLARLGRAADAVSRRLHPEPYRTYNIDRNINYTNICAAVCDFCAFYRKSNDADAYVLPREVLYQKIEETIALGGDQILMQGGLHPKFKLEWYEELLRDLKARFPQVNLHAFSPPELWHFHKLNKIPLREVLRRLKDAGMGSLPGGGGEILVDRVRKAMTVNKCLTDEWLEVHRIWHELGGRSTCTMMFGHIETLAERIETLERLRRLQDETAGFKIGQLALLYGANDMGSLMIEENVVASAGTVHYLTLEQIKNAIRELGYIPRQRNVFYEYVDEVGEEGCKAASGEQARPQAA